MSDNLENQMPADTALQIQEEAIARGAVDGVEPAPVVEAPVEAPQAIPPHLSADTLLQMQEEAIAQGKSEEEVNNIVNQAMQTATVSEAKPSDAITTPSYERTEAKGIGLVGNGAIGSVTVPVQKKKKKNKDADKPKEETVAIYSTKNVTWNGVGKVYRGYNIVSKSDAKKWLTRNHIREARPEDVAREFGR